MLPGMANIPMMLNNNDIKRLRKIHFGLDYSEFLEMVCKDCKNKCWLGEENCPELTRLSEEYGF